MYTLYCYNKNDNVYNEFKHFSKLQRAKEFVETVREIGSLTCALYIRSDNKRILKRYPEI